MASVLLRVALGFVGGFAGYGITWWLTSGLHALSGSDNTAPGVVLCLLGLFTGMALAARLVRSRSRAARL